MNETDIPAHPKVIRSTGSHYEVMMPDGEVQPCRLRGKMKLKGSRLTNPVAVGDEVEVSVDEDGYGWIEAVLARRNHIIRRSTNLSKEAHIIAANVDQLLLMATLKSPSTSKGFVDRVLVTAEAYHIPSILIINKADLLEGDKDLKALEEWKAIYASAGYPVYVISAKEADRGMLGTLLKDKITLLSGHSGVGKSTLANRIEEGLKLRTDAVSKAYDKGKHTTTFAEMHPLSIGGFLVDTPGIKGFGILNIPKDELAQCFPEMRALMHDCRFNNCQHINEPGCAVKEALEAGKMSWTRYDSYLGMYEQDESSFRKDIYG